MAIEKIKIDTAKAKKKKRENEKDEWKRQYVTELHLKQKTRKQANYCYMTCTSINYAK